MTSNRKLVFIYSWKRNLIQSHDKMRTWIFLLLKLAYLFGRWLFSSRAQATGQQEERFTSCQPFTFLSDFLIRICLPMFISRKTNVTFIWHWIWKKSVVSLFWDKSIWKIRNIRWYEMCQGRISLDIRSLTCYSTLTSKCRWFKREREYSLRTNAL